MERHGSCPSSLSHVRRPSSHDVLVSEAIAARPVVIRDVRRVGLCSSTSLAVLALSDHDEENDRPEESHEGDDDTCNRPSAQTVGAQDQAKVILSVACSPEKNPEKKKTHEEDLEEAALDRPADGLDEGEAEVDEVFLSVGVTTTVDVLLAAVVGVAVVCIVEPASERDEKGAVLSALS